MSFLMGGVLFVGAFLAMELVAWSTHKYLMHGWLWFLHRSHHYRNPPRWQANDLFGIFFSLPSIAAIAWGLPDFAWPFWVGLGMAAYGAVYLFVHDMLIHGRFSKMPVPGWSYARRLIAAHRLHHSRETRLGARSFGFLLVPSRYRELPWY